MEVLKYISFQVLESESYFKSFMTVEKLRKGGIFTKELNLDPYRILLTCK